MNLTTICFPSRETKTLTITTAELILKHQVEQLTNPFAADLLKLELSHREGTLHNQNLLADIELLLGAPLEEPTVTPAS